MLPSHVLLEKSYSFPLGQTQENNFVILSAEHATRLLPQLLQDDSVKTIDRNTQ